MNIFGYFLKTTGCFNQEASTTILFTVVIYTAEQYARRSLTVTNHHLHLGLIMNDSYLSILSFNYIRKNFVVYYNN